MFEAWVGDMKLLVIIREVIDDGGWYESVHNPVETTATNDKNSRIRQEHILKKNGVVVVQNKINIYQRPKQ